MALKRLLRIIDEHSDAIVADSDHRLTAIGQVDLNSSSPRIKGVFNQFLDYGSGTLDHFSGCDLVDRVQIQKADGRHPWSLQLIEARLRPSEVRLASVLR